MELKAFLSRYARQVDVSAGTVAQYNYAVIAFSRFLKRPATLDDLTDQALNAWIEHRLQSGLARITIRNQTAAIKTLWKAAREQRLVGNRPEFVKRLRVNLPIVRTLTESQLEMVLTSCMKIDGRFPSGVPRGRLLWALFLTDYFSGLRRCDIIDVPTEQALSDLWLVRQKKTGDIVTFAPPILVREAIERTYPPHRERAFPLTIKALWYWINQIKGDTGIRFSFKSFRSAGATHVEMTHPGSAQAYLGQRTPGLAWKHYIDRHQIQNSKPLPPSLFKNGTAPLGN